MEEELKKLISENKVIPFVGAGVSKDIKYKSGEKAFVNWKELLIKLNEIVLEEPTKNYIKHCIDTKKIDYLQIADMIEKELTRTEFNKILKDIFDINFNEINASTLELAKTIWELNCKLIITTNYDKVLYHTCSDTNKKFWDIEAIHEQALLLTDGINQSTIWHLHGHIDNVNNIILTSKKYNELYTTDSTNSKYKSALETLRTMINTKFLLFIGFSLDDEFVLNQLNRTIEIFGGNSHQHYVLCKKGSNPNTLNKNIRVIEYENHGQDLIDKIKSLIPTSKNIENTTEEKISNQSKEEFKQLTILPQINKDFIGRKEELEEIEKRLAQNSLICIVNGIGGVGKSELSYKYLHENKYKYKNIAFVEFTKDDTSLEEVFIRKFKEDLYLENDVILDSIIKRLQKLPQRNLLLLDNLENVEDFEKIKVLNTNFDLLITTRKDIDSKNQLNLDTLNPKDAKELFLNIFNQDENIEDILVYLDNHPLFITLTAKSLDKKYITLEELRENIKNNTISKIDSKDDKTFKEHLQNTFDRQFTSESKDELKELLQILAIFPSIEISFEILQKSIGLEKLRVNLQKLVERGWLTNKENSYKLHQIIRTFILTDYKIEYERVTFIFENIAKYINPDDSTLIANKLNVYIPIIESFLEVFKEKDDDFICGILDSITYLFYSLAQYKKSFEYQNRALEFRIKNYGEKSEYTARSNHLISIIYKAMGKLKEALDYQEKSLKLREEILEDKHLDLAQNYNQIALIYQDMGDLKKALEYQEKSLKLKEEILGDKHPNLAASYNNISMIYQDMGDLKKALEYQEKSLKLKEEILGDKHPNLAASYNNISMIYQDMGDLKKALEYQEKSLKLKEEILGDKHPNLATNYNNISTIYKNMGELKKALEYQEKSLKLREEILGDKHPELATSYNNISMIYKDLKECLNAKRYMQKAVDIWKEYEYFNKELFQARNYIKAIDYDIRKNKNKRFCKDI
ncbi:tetratricopeptide repeat protein [Aliarcobacter butzleri]|uniref:tetratricopeptide repeat protein n=1 Tax=Aliarcobacter butzleri TaxID=28197 RepID=UPI0021B3A6DC|nr:tetratricopeptide repeat protein [Aliarcobacter butzleri]MCT7548319.1 tetratricopeptide repeat protein [Aliarcobacter butzleri]